MIVDKTAVMLKFLLINIGLLAMCNAAGCSEFQSRSDEGRIIFQSNRDGDYKLYIMNPDGSSAKKITDFPGSKFGPNDNNRIYPSPDGRKIIFVSDKDENLEIYAIDVASGDQSNLTKSKAAESSVAWSPDGKQIAFVSDRDLVLVDANRSSRTKTNDIYIANSDGSNVRRVTINNTTEQYGSLAWSPNGEQLAVTVSSQSPGPSVSLIYLLNLHSVDRILLTSPDGTVHSVGAWSPNGEQLLYFRSGSMSENAHVTNTDKTHQAVLSNDALGIVINASWSPDGTRIVFSTMKIQENAKYYSLYTVNADGTNLTPLSKDSMAYDTSPSWSPDGKYIVFASKRDGGKYHLYIMDADGANQRRLTNGPGEEASPIWLP